MTFKSKRQTADSSRYQSRPTNHLIHCGCLCGVTGCVGPLSSRPPFEWCKGSFVLSGIPAYYCSSRCHIQYVGIDQQVNVLPINLRIFSAIGANVTLASWSQWSSCSVTCGGGLTSRWRQCTDGSYTCTRTSPSDRFHTPRPLLEFKSCSYNLCPDKMCSGRY